MQKKVAIVILNWNGVHFMERFLPVLIERTPADKASIIIADNASTDGSLDFLKRNYPQLQVLLFDRNYGFTGGYNRALRQIDTQYYVLLNSDVEVCEGWLDALVDAMDANPQMGACMPKIVSWTKPEVFEYAGACGGFIDRYGFPFCRGRILSKIEKDTGQYDNPMPIFWASGACLMVRSSVYHALGGLDNAFFAHMEEIDFCWRVQLNGMQVWSVPGSCVRHVGGGTLPNNSPRKLFFNYRNNLYMLYKNLPDRKIVPILAVRLVIDWLSAAAYLVQGKFTFFGAVAKAHRAFWKGRHALERTPSRNQGLPVAGVYNGMIIASFFLKLSKLTFSKLASMQYTPSEK